MGGLYTAGGLVGALTSSVMADRFGRKRVIFGASIIATIGGALQGGSINLGMFIFVRFISGLGVGEYSPGKQHPHAFLTRFRYRSYISVDSYVPNRSLPPAFPWYDGGFAWCCHYPWVYLRELDWIWILLC